MTRKSLVFFLLFMFVLSLLASPIFAAKAKKATSGNGIPCQGTMKTERVVGGDYDDPGYWGPRGGIGTATMGFRSGDGRPDRMKIGSTWYEYQHNGTMGRQIAVGSDGNVQFCWMHLDNPDPTYYRSIFFNCAKWSGGAWTLTHDTSGTELSGENGGYTTLDVYGDKAVIGWHEGPTPDTYGPWVAKDFASCGGDFTLKAAPLYDCEDTETEGGDDGSIWPVIDADNDGTTSPIVHVLATESDNDNYYASMDYFRGHGPGFTEFDTCDTGTPHEGFAGGMFVDSVAMTAGVICEDPNSDNVAIIWPDPKAKYDGSIEAQYNCDIFVMKSTDLGETWGAKSNITNYPLLSTERAYTNLTAMYDHNGCLHVIFDAILDYNPATGASSLEQGVLRHWDDCENCVSLVTNADNEQDCDPGRWNLNASKPNISECRYQTDPDLYRLYVTYTWFYGDDDDGTTDCSAAGYANGDIYCQASATNGVTWGPPVNLTGTATDSCIAGECMSEHWPSASRYSDDSLYILYVEDKDAGGWAGGGAGFEGAATSNDMIFMTHPCFEMDIFEQLSANPAEFLDPFNAKPDAAIDTTFTVMNSGNDTAFYTISYTGTPTWAVTGGAGYIPVGCINSVEFNLTGTAPSAEGLYQAEVIFTYDGGAKTLVIPVDLYCFNEFFIPEDVKLETASNALNVQQASRVGHQQVGAMFSWPNDPDDSLDYLFDGSLIIATDRENVNFQMFHEVGDKSKSSNPWRELRALSITYSDKTSYPSYEYAEGVGCTQDSTIAFVSQFYAPKHEDSAGFYIAHYNLFAGPKWIETIDPLIIAYGIDWDVPSDTGSDNLGGVDANLQLVYQQGQYPGSEDENEYRYGGQAYRGDYEFNKDADGGFNWDNPTYIYPEQSYHVDTLMKYLPITSTWTATDSLDDLNSIIAIAHDATIGAANTFCFSIIIATSNDGTGPKSLSGLKTSVTSGAQFICDHVAPNAPHCGFVCDCTPGDADGNTIINISDAVYLISFIFGGGLPPKPYAVCNGDADCNGIVNISDAVFLIGYIFGGTAAPCSCEEWVAANGLPLR